MNPVHTNNVVGSLHAVSAFINFHNRNFQNINFHKQKIGHREVKELACEHTADWLGSSAECLLLVEEQRRKEGLLPWGWGRALGLLQLFPWMMPSQ